MKRSAALLSFIAALTSTCLAVDTRYFTSSEVVAGSASGGAITFGYIIQLIFSLAIVFGFIFIGAKYLLPKFSSSTKGRLIQVDDKVVLEPQVTSYIIKVANESWLIVVSNKHVARIDKLEGKI
jgi:flagellar biogenesis protein FliO